MKLRLIVLLMLLATILGAQTLWDNAVPLRQGTNIEWFRTSTSTDDGGVLYVWSDTKSGDRDLWAMKYDAAGTPVWGTEPILIDGKVDRQEDPVVIKTSDSNYIIAWLEFSLDANGDVFAQKINNDGDLLWAEGGIPVSVNSDVQASLNIVEDADGGAYILWKDSRNPSLDLYAAHLNSEGVNTWTADGHPIANSDLSEGSNSMREDTFGGFVIGYVVTVNNQKDIYVKRIDSDGNSVWGEPIEMAVAAGAQESLKVAPDGVGGYVFTWQDQRYTSPDIYARRILADGTFAWDDNVVVYGDEPSENGVMQVKPRIKSDGAGNVMIIWEDSRFSIESPGLYGQKLDQNGNKLWDEDGVLIADTFVRSGTTRTSGDGEGGIYVIWTDSRNFAFPNVDIYAQHIESAGTLAWGTEGKAICTEINEQNNPLIKGSGDNVFAVWLDKKSGSEGISQQIINSSNNEVLAENGEYVFWGLSGDAGKNSQLVLLPRQAEGDAVAIWQDTRFASNGYQIYFQFVNTDGSYDLDYNGKGVTIASGANQEYPDAVVTPEGQVCITWLEQRGIAPKVYAQLIDVDGTYLWGDEGMELTDAETVGQGTPHVEYVDGDFYFGWSDNYLVVFTNYLRVYGQKISNGVKQWDPNGKLISETATGGQVAEATLVDIIRNNYIWKESAYHLRLKRVDAEGNGLAGFPAEGQLVSPEYTGVRDVVGATKDNEIFLAWNDIRDDYVETTYVQSFDDTGSIGWEENMFASNPGDPDNGVYVTSLNPKLVVDDGVYVSWAESSTGANYDIKMQKFSYEGEKLWGEDGLSVCAKDSTQQKQDMCEISNGYYLLAWEDQFGVETDIYMNIVRSDGTLISGDEGEVVTTELKNQYTPLVASLGNGKAFVAWADGISSGKTEILGVYTQFIDATLVPVTETTVSPIVASLNQNYPNPFNPETNISFNLSKDMKNVELSVYNIKGQKVKTLLKDNLTQGAHNIVWNGTNGSDDNVASGVYFYKLKAGDQSLTRKMILMK